MSTTLTPDPTQHAVPATASGIARASQSPPGDRTSRSGSATAQALAVLDGLCARLGARFGSIRVARDQDQELVRLAFRGGEPLRSVSGEPIRPEPALPWNRALESNETVVVPSLEVLIADWPSAAKTPAGRAAIAAGARAFCWIPLMGARNLRAVVFLAFDRPREFSAEERAAIHEAVNECKWPLLQSVETDRADGLASALAHLHRLSIDLNGATAPVEVAQLGLNVLLEVMGADSGTVRRLTPDGRRFEVLFSSGHTEDAVAARRMHPVGTGTPMDHAVQTGAAIFLESTGALKRSGMTAPALAEHADRAWAVVPLVVGSKPVGAIGLSFHERHAFSSADRSFMMSVGEQCAMALHRALLSEGERTARRQIEAEHQRLQQIVDVIPFGVAVVQDGRYVLQNSAAAAMMGHEVVGSLVPARSALGYGVTHLDGTPYRSGELPVERSLLAGEVVTGEQLEVVRPGASTPRTLLCSSLPLRNAEQGISGAVVVFQDITQLRQAEARRNLLLARITHDVKNPLTAMKLRCALTAQRAHKGTLDPAQVAESFRQLEMTASRAATILNSIMQLTRHELGLSLPIARTRCDLGALATRVADELRSTTDIHTVCVELPPDPIVGYWDEQALTSILENLIGNSIKYSPGGGHIVIRLDPEWVAGKPWAKLTVQDHGLGISQEDLPHIFDAFYRARATAGVEGSGLGLSAAKEFVEALGGTLEAASQVGQGTVFTVRLPMDWADTPDTAA